MWDVWDAEAALTLALLCFSHWWLVMEQLVSVLMILTMRAGVGVERCGARQQGVGGNLIYKTARNPNDQKLCCWISHDRRWDKKATATKLMIAINNYNHSIQRSGLRKVHESETVRSFWPSSCCLNCHPFVKKEAALFHLLLCLLTWSQWCVSVGGLRYFEVGGCLCVNR